MAPVYHKVIEAFSAGDLTAARRWQMLSIQIIAVMVRHGGLPANKAIMNMIGLDCGPVRPPLKNLTAAECDALRQDLERVGFPAQVPGSIHSARARADDEALEQMKTPGKVLADSAPCMTGNPVLNAASLEFSQLPALPDREGFAGAFAGVTGGSLIVAGGANFPGQETVGGRKEGLV